MSDKLSILNRYKTEAVIFIFLFLSLIVRFLYVMPDMDEIWNYQFARRILYGDIPYRDFFMMATPFSAQINAAILFLFCDELFVFKYVALFIAVLQGMVLFLILQYIGNDELKSFIFICAYICMVTLFAHNNYSWFVILFLSMAMYLELKNTKCKKGILEEFLIGIILGMATITKQNIGILGLFVSVVMSIYYLNAKLYSFKVFVCNVLAKILGWIIIVGIEIIYLWQNDSLKHFYEQSIQNPIIFAKVSAIPYYALFANYANIYAVFALLLPLIMLLLLIKFLMTKNIYLKNIQLTVLLYSIVNFIILYPLADPAHLILASIIPIVSLSLLFVKDIKSVKYEVKPIRFFLFIIITTISFNLLGFLLNSNYDHVLKANHYNNIRVNKDVALKLEEIDSFIMSEKQKEKKIFFLDYQSAFYLIPLDIFNYKSDSMLRSEMDQELEDEIIKNLSSPDNNNIVLIRKKDSIPNRQEPDIFVNYVRRNMNYSKTIHNFDVYIN